MTTKAFQKILWLITVSMVAVSCHNFHIEKRHYNKGFYFQHRSMPKNENDLKDEQKQLPEQRNLTDIESELKIDRLKEIPGTEFNTGKPYELPETTNIRKTSTDQLKLTSKKVYFEFKQKVNEKPLPHLEPIPSRDDTPLIVKIVLSTFIVIGAVLLLLLIMLLPAASAVSNGSVLPATAVIAGILGILVCYLACLLIIRVFNPSSRRSEREKKRQRIIAFFTAIGIAALFLLAFLLLM